MYSMAGRSFEAAQGRQNRTQAGLVDATAQPHARVADLDFDGAASGSHRRWRGGARLVGPVLILSKVLAPKPNSRLALMPPFIAMAATDTRLQAATSSSLNSGVHADDAASLRLA